MGHAVASHRAGVSALCGGDPLRAFQSPQRRMVTVTWLPLGVSPTKVAIQGVSTGPGHHVAIELSHECSPQRRIGRIMLSGSCFD
jgi:hypothetical protein